MPLLRLTDELFTVTTDSCPHGLFALDQEQLRSPYDLYRKWRELGPVVYLQEQDIYIVTRHDLIKSVNRQPGLFSNQNPLGPSSALAAEAIAAVLGEFPEEAVTRATIVLNRGNVLFTADPPEHTRHRRLLNVALKRSAIERIKDDIELIARQAVGGLDRGNTIDLNEQLAVPVPIHCLAALLGVPREYTADFHRWAEAINASIGAAMSKEKIRQVIQDQMDFWSFFEAEILARTDAPGQDLLSAIATATSAIDAPLTLSEKVGFCSQLIGAGADTTTKLIGFATLAMAQDQTLQDELRQEPEKIGPFAEEILRLEPPVQGMFRVTTADTELNGVKISQGSMVWLLYGSANRDERVFACPNEVNLARPNRRDHLSFGSGPHVCIGANLAREVARSVLKELLAQTRQITLPASAKQPGVLPSYVMHGLQSLPVTLT
ncbi:MAG: cytochrome P450 [Halioglobus sp.]